MKEQLAARRLQDLYYVRCPATVCLVDAYADQAGAKKVEDPYLTSVIGELRFRPALEKASRSRVSWPLT